MGLEDSKTFRDAHAILFAEQLLPGLRGQVEIDEIGDQPDYRELDGVPVIHFVTPRAPDDDQRAAPTGSTSRSRSPSTAPTSRWPTCWRR